MKISLFVLITSLFFSLNLQSDNHPRIELSTLAYNVYPDLNDQQPNLPSPFTTTDGEEYVIAVNKDGKYAIMPVTLTDSRGMCQQLVIDVVDFPTLKTSGLHDKDHLKQIKTITGRSVAEITRLAQPGGLSQGGFMVRDEDIVSVLHGDNRLVTRLGLTHPQLAAPLFHVLNMMDEDLDLNRWNMAKHQWEHIQSFFYNDQTVFVDAQDTKGGQLSIFDDGIEGAFYIKLWRELDVSEEQFLSQRYAHLTASEFDSMKTLLTFINSGEMQPQYIKRYGFYEGHTFWRTDPIAIACIFGLTSVEEIEKAFPSRLYEALTEHHTPHKKL